MTVFKAIQKERKDGQVIRTTISFTFVLREHSDEYQLSRSVD